MQQRGVLFLAMVLILTGCVSAPPEDEPTMVSALSDSVQITVGGVDRDFLIRAPAHRDDEALPVLIGLHGAGDTPEAFESYTGFTDAIEADRFIAVYPQGQPIKDGRLVWNAGTCCGDVDGEFVDDITFLSDVIAAMPDYGGDSSRIYVVGYSNGGMMTYGVGCELGDQIAGIAVVSGALNVTQCPSTESMPVQIVHGTADVVIPFDGGLASAGASAGLRPWENASVWAGVQLWLERDGCSDDFDETYSGVVTTTSYTDCENNSSLTVSVIDGGEHIWPSDPDNLDATALVLDSFITAG